MLRKSLLVILFLFPALCPAADYQRGGERAELQYYVKSSGTADDVIIQAAINTAEATGQICTVRLAPGSYDMDNPIYIGYSAGKPNQTVGCNLVCDGLVDMQSDLNDLQKFVIYFSPSSGGRQPRIQGPLFIRQGTRAGGIYSTGLNNGSIRDVRVDSAYVAGIWCDECWGLEVDDVRLTGIRACAFGATEFNGGHADRITCVNNTGHYLGHTGYQGINRYQYDASTGTFWPGEDVKISNDAGQTRGVLLGIDSTTIWIGHCNLTAFVNDDVIYGDDSGATATVDGNETDVGAMIYLFGGHGKLSNLVADGNSYSDEQSNDYEFPFIYVDSVLDNWAQSMVLEKLRFEGTDGDTLPEADTRRGTQTYIRVDHADGTVIRDMNIITAAGTSTGLLTDNTTAVAGDGDGTSLVTADEAFVDVLAAGDTVHLWDGGANDGDYTVEASPGGAVATEFGISDGDFTDAAMYGYALTAAEDRNTPSVMVDIIDCEHVLVENVRTSTFQTALVQIDSNCTDCEVRNVLPTRQEISGGTEGTILYNGPHGVIVSDSGTGTKLVNPFTPTYGNLLYVGKTGVEVVDETDGIAHKTTLILQETTTITDAGAGDEGWGTEEIYTFPEGHILVLGVVGQVYVDTNAAWDTNDVLENAEEGDLAIGTSAITDESGFGATDVDLMPSTAITIASQVDTVNGALAASAQFDGSAAAKTVNVNILFDAGTTDANTTVGLKGTVTIHWIDLGDY